MASRAVSQNCQSFLEGKWTGQRVGAGEVFVASGFVGGQTGGEIVVQVR